MKKIKIYTTSQCPFCVHAKKLLKSKGIDFEEINIADNENYMLDKLIEKTGVRTVPQIFADEKFIGGCDDIYMLERQNKLDEILGTIKE